MIGYKVILKRHPEFKLRNRTVYYWWVSMMEQRLMTFFRRLSLTAIETLVCCWLLTYEYNPTVKVEPAACITITTLISWLYSDHSCIICLLAIVVGSIHPIFSLAPRKRSLFVLIHINMKAVKIVTATKARFIGILLVPCKKFGFDFGLIVGTRTRDPEIHWSWPIEYVMRGIFKHQMLTLCDNLILLSITKWGLESLLVLSGFISIFLEPLTINNHLLVTFVIVKKIVMLFGRWFPLQWNQKVALKYFIRSKKLQAKICSPLF